MSLLVGEVGCVVKCKASAEDQSSIKVLQEVGLKTIKIANYARKETVKMIVNGSFDKIERIKEVFEGVRGLIG